MELWQMNIVDGMLLADGREERLRGATDERRHRPLFAAISHQRITATGHFA